MPYFGGKWSIFGIGKQPFKGGKFHEKKSLIDEIIKVHYKSDTNTWKKI